MPRSVPEWIGEHPDQRIPDRVQLRVFVKFDGRCQCGCGRKIRGEPWQTDHKIALINGGEHRENNLQPVIYEHHKTKTREDVAEKSRTYRKRRANLGLKQSRNPLPGSRASGWKRKMNGTWEQRR